MSPSSLPFDEFHLIESEKVEDKSGITISVAKKANQVLEKLILMLDVHLSVKYSSFLMVLLMGISGISTIFRIPTITESDMLTFTSTIWIVINIVSFALVAYGLDKNIKICLVPALVLCPIVVTLSCANFTMNIFPLSLTGAIWLATTTGITVCYWLALFSVYNDMSGSVTSPGATETNPPMMPG